MKKQVKFNKIFNISHNKTMIDLIDECGEDLDINRYQIKKDEKYAIEVAKLSVENKNQQKKTGFDKGDYVILSSPLTHYLDSECHNYISSILKKNLQNMMKIQGVKRGDKVLIVGLGNPGILADALGSKVIEKIDIKTEKKDNYIFKFTPNIFASTGINSFDMVHMLAIWLDIDYVILIDSLATANINRLGISIQLNSAGITPGSAVHNLGRKISKDTLGIPCFAIGVPLMLMADQVIEDSPKELILAPKDIHENLDNLSYIISKAIMGTI